VLPPLPLLLVCRRGWLLLLLLWCRPVWLLLPRVCHRQVL
jgi:hypothetical protein